MVKKLEMLQKMNDKGKWVKLKLKYRKYNAGGKKEKKMHGL